MVRTSIFILIIVALGVSLFLQRLEIDMINSELILIKATNRNKGAVQTAVNMGILNNIERVHYENMELLYVFTKNTLQINVISSCQDKLIKKINKLIDNTAYLKRNCK